MSRYRQLVEHVFERSAAAQDLPGWIEDQFDADRDVSWRELERRIEEQTEGLVTVSHVTLAAWFGPVRVVA